MGQTCQYLTPCCHIHPSIWDDASSSGMPHHALYHSVQHFVLPPLHFAPQACLSLLFSQRFLPESRSPGNCTTYSASMKRQEDMSRQETNRIPRHTVSGHLQDVCTTLAYTAAQCSTEQCLETGLLSTGTFKIADIQQNSTAPTAISKFMIQLAIQLSVTQEEMSYCPSGNI